MNPLLIAVFVSLLYVELLLAHEYIHYYWADRLLFHDELIMYTDSVHCDFSLWENPDVHKWNWIVSLSPMIILLPLELLLWALIDLFLGTGYKILFLGAVMELYFIYFSKDLDIYYYFKSPTVIHGDMIV